MAHFNVGIFFDNEMSDELKRERLNRLFSKFDINSEFAGTSKNPDGHIDSWQIIGQISDDRVEDVLLGRTQEFGVLNAVITLDDNWIEGPWVYAESEDSRQKLEEWENKLRTVLSNSPNSILLLANAHS